MIKKIIPTLTLIFLFAVNLSAQIEANFVTINPLVSSQKVEISQISQENLPERVEIRVFDMFGILLFRHLQPLDKSGKMLAFSLDLSEFAAAAYLVEVRQGNRWFKTKIIKRHH